MTGRKLLRIALAAAALYAAVLVASAQAEMHKVQVTLVTGQVLTVNVDVPPGTPVQQVQIPGLPAPVQNIVDLGPISTPTPVPTPTVPAVPDVPDVPVPTKPGGQNGGGGGGKDGSGSAGGNTGSGGSANTQAPSPDENAVNRADSNVRSGVGRARDKVEQKVKQKAEDVADRTTNPDGSPTPANPTYSVSTPGPARIGVPNFFIDKFRIPPFLLPIYQAAGIQYGVRWEILAAINEIETDYGRNLNVSSAGAVGWMQFLPSTWRLYGVDANGDDVKDPYNPVDAIFAAARYLRAAGADQDIRRAVFAYNHADWYVDSVLLRAQVIGGLPSNLVGSLTGLTQGRFPVQAKATYAGELKQRGQRVRAGNAAMVVESSNRRDIRIFSRADAPVIAVNDGRIVDIGENRRLGRFVKLQDVYGNTYTYGHLDRVAERYPTPKPQPQTEGDVRRELQLPDDKAPTAPASATDAPAAKAPARKLADRAAPRSRKADPKPEAPSKERLFANPTRPNSASAGGAQQEFERTGVIDDVQSFEGYYERILGLSRDEVRLKRMRPGARVVAGTILGRLGRVDRRAPYLQFEIRPAGQGAPRVDPKPILDGWKLLESTAIYRAKGKNPFFGADADNPSIGQILLMSKEALVRHVLNNPQIDVYECGRRDIRAGQIDRRVLATLEFLAASGLRPTVTSLHCGHSYLTTSGNVSEHSTGTAVDIAAVNGITISPATQGKGSITELTIQRLLTLQGTMKPHQIISLMKFDGTDNTFAMGDHDDHIHVGFRPLYGTNTKAARQINAILKPRQWIKLIDRLGEIDNPTVRRTPSKYAVPTKSSQAHEGE
ncbi:MAG TPA: lytic murein transglycosylase [Solirubrobacteraceae bacterium]|nr:lytic murein transglycosylase [Solirubrobacteraceae bacterium]